MRALCAAIITAGAVIGLGLTGIGLGLRYQNMHMDNPNVMPFVRWGQLDTPMMLVLVVLLATLLVGLAATFLGLAYHHERRNFERTRGLGETPSAHFPIKD